VVAARSDPALLALHGVRVLGGPSALAVAERYSLPVGEVREHLLDAQAFGWVNRHDYYGETWSLTDRGRVENERQLAAELEATGCRDTVRRVHAEFLPLNRRHGQASTDWQLRPTRWDRAAANDHTDPVWDDAVLAELEAVDEAAQQLCGVLADVLSRFDGHARRHREALQRVRRGQPEWLDAPDRPSCQLVWMQLHEDLLATLGLPRGSDN
jgi:hypothetical protein